MHPSLMKNLIVLVEKISIYYLKYVRVVEKKIEKKTHLKNKWPIFFSDVYILNSSSLNLFVVVLAQTECHLVYVKSQLNNFIIIIIMYNVVQSLQLAGSDEFIVIALT